MLTPADIRVVPADLAVGLTGVVSFSRIVPFFAGGQTG
jgi:hypothetical protein